jgi:hypothetical protein
VIRESKSLPLDFLELKSKGLVLAFTVFLKHSSFCNGFLNTFSRKSSGAGEVECLRKSPLGLYLVRIPGNWDRIERPRGV